LDGSKIGAVDLQRIYLELAQQYLAGKDAQTDWILREWEYVLAGLELDPMTLADRLDWVAKRKLFQMYMDSEGVDWKDDVLQSLDLEYHNANRETGLYYGLVQAGQMQRVTTDEAIDEAVNTPPPDTRALGRSRVIRSLLESKNKRYVIDWDSIYVDRERFMDLRNPFHTYKREAEKFASKL
jgi:proteasome accessory factor A